MKTAIVTSARIFSEGENYYIDNGINVVLERYQRRFGNLTLFGMDGSDKGQIPLTATMICTELDVHIVGNRNQILFGKLRSELERLLIGFDFIIVRSPSKMADMAAKVARKYNIPYFVEVIGDAFDGLWYHSLKAKPFALSSYLRTKQTVYHANFALYVSQDYLQSRYPCKNYSVGISDCIVFPLSDIEVKEKEARLIRDDYTTISIFHAAAIDVKYKGQEFIIKAISFLNQEGIHVKLCLAGNGNPAYLKSIAEKLGVLDQVEFLGGLPQTEVVKYMQQTDFYVQPSLTEALGRSVVEALSQGMICIGTNVGGIPELIREDFLVRTKSAQDIFEKIMYFINLPEDKKKAIFKRNLTHSENYVVDKLEAQRERYYDYVIQTLEKEQRSDLNCSKESNPGSKNKL